MNTLYYNSPPKLICDMYLVTYSWKHKYNYCIFSGDSNLAVWLIS